MGTALAESEQASVKHVVNIVLAGGLSQLESFDPKPDAPSEIRGESTAIQTAVPGMFISEWLPLLSRQAGNVAIVRGVSHQIGIHEAALTCLHTGVKAFRNDTPSLGAIASCWKPVEGNVPSYAAVPALPPNAGELGQRHEPFNTLGDSGRLLQLGPDLLSEDQVQEFNYRQELLAAIDWKSGTPENPTALRQRSQAYEQARRNLVSPHLRSLFNLDDEPAATRAAYGKSEPGDFLLMARRLVEAGVRFVTVQLSGWDTHSDHFSTLKSLMPPLDLAVSALIQDLRQRGLLQSMMLTVVTEFGRTPTVNTMQGRDHWPGAYSILLAGGRIRGGQVFGATDQVAGSVQDGKCSPEDLAFTILQELGIQPDRTYVPPSGRVLLSEGRFLNELF